MTSHLIVIFPFGSKGSYAPAHTSQYQGSWTRIITDLKKVWEQPETHLCKKTSWHRRMQRWQILLNFGSWRCKPPCFRFKKLGLFLLQGWTGGTIEKEWRGVSSIWEGQTTGKSCVEHCRVRRWLTYWWLDLKQFSYFHLWVVLSISWSNGFGE